MNTRNVQDGDVIKVEFDSTDVMLEADMRAEEEAKYQIVPNYDLKAEPEWHELYTMTAA